MGSEGKEESWESGLASMFRTFRGLKLPNLGCEGVRRKYGLRGKGGKLGGQASHP